MNSPVSPESGLLVGVIVAVVSFIGWLLRQAIQRRTKKIDDLDKKLNNKLEDVITLPMCKKEHAHLKEDLASGEKKFDRIAEEMKTQGLDITELKTKVDLLPKLIIAELKENGGKVKFEG